MTVSQVFQEYLIRIGKPNLFDNNSNIIEFIYHGKTIDFRNNNTKIEEFFGNRNSVEIQIITNDLIGAWILIYLFRKRKINYLLFYINSSYYLY